MSHRSKWVLALGLALISCFSQAETGFLVLAPDRGFVGNNFSRDAFDAFSENYMSRLVFVTDERARPYFERAVESLIADGAERIVLMPLYLSQAHPDLARIDRWRRAIDSVETLQGRAFGQSYLAPLVLAERLAQADAHGGRLVVIGQGADSDEQAQAMRAELDRLAHAAAKGLHFDRIEARILAEDDDMNEALADLGEDDLVVPFHLGPLFSEMMAWSNWLKRALPDSARWLEGEVMPHPAVGAWMQREALRHVPIAASDMGVVVHAHGADFHWNETMRQAAAPLAEDYLVDYAFSMGGAPELRRAVNRLEQRGARAVVVVRVFSMSNSFVGGIEHLIGADYESCRSGNVAGHGHGGTPSRLLSALPVVTVGGLEDDPLFAQALLERARVLSEDPGRETVILVAHGKGDDDGNEQWLGLLESIRRQMNEAGGEAFRAIEVGTWREDWPDKRDKAVGEIRGFIEQANVGQGSAIVIPARTTGQGPARELIADLPFDLGEGFAPHPLFVTWLEKQVDSGREAIGYDMIGDWSCNG